MSEKPKRLKKPEEVHFEWKDNAPWNTMGEFAKSAAASYYYMDTPSTYMLMAMARRTAFGFRLVYSLSDDEWINNYKVMIKDLEKIEQNKTADQIFVHEQKIHVWDEFEKATAWEKEMGESLIFIHRENTATLDPQVMIQPADINSKVIRVEAIHSTDYSIQQNGLYYNISFNHSADNHPDLGVITETGTTGPYSQSFIVHHSHCIRIATRQTEYGQYKCDQSYLLPIYPLLNILALLEQCIGDASHRWGTGIPVVYFKGVRDQVDLLKKQQAIGNPTSRKWLGVPMDMIEKIEMIGVQGTMINIEMMFNAIISSIVAYCCIPRPILLGEVAGVVSGSEVNERSYFGLLDRFHLNNEQWVRKFHELDPEIRDLIAGRPYSVDWGIHQVFTESQLAEILLQKLSAANAAAGFSTFNEVRILAGEPPWEEAIKPELCMKIYGYEPAEMGGMAFTTVRALLEGAIQFANEQSQDPNNPNSGNEKKPEAKEEDEDEDEEDEKEDPNIQKKKEEAVKAVKDSLQNLNQVIGGHVKMAKAMGLAKGTFDKIWNNVDNVKAE